MPTFSFDDQNVFSELDHGCGVQCYLHIPGFQGERETEIIAAAVDAWTNWENGPSLQIRFRLTAALEFAIGSHAFPKTGKIDKEAKPLFDAFKREFQEMINTIDKLEFEDSPYPSPLSDRLNKTRKKDT